ncbi:DapH/DapD/GlmU-related protein [Sorangium sp. So ce1335]
MHGRRRTPRGLLEPNGSTRAVSPWAFGRPVASCSKRDASGPSRVPQGCPGSKAPHILASKPRFKIGDNVWLGAGVIVLPGVTIGDNTVVGAGAVVTRDLPANVLAVGNPARVIRSIDSAESRAAAVQGHTRR